MAGFQFNRLADMLRDHTRDIALLKRQAATGRMQTFSPVLTGASSDPTHDPALSVMWWYRNNEFFQATFSILLGAGYANGSGAMRMSLPVPLDTLQSGAPDDYGQWTASDLSTPLRAFGTLSPVIAGTPDDRVAFEYQSAYPTGTFAAATYAVPWTWDVGDWLRGTVCGRVPPGS